VLVTVLVASAIFVTQFVMLPPFEVEDAWIGFSYAKNLANGHGFVFGHDGRVEGYSNFLWIVLLTPFLAVNPGMSPLLAARLLAVPFALVLGWSTLRIVQRASGSRIAAALALCLLATASDVALAALSGLETFAYTALITAAFALHATARDDLRVRRYVLPVFVGVALMRIDGMVPLAFVLAWDARTSGGRGRVREWAQLAALAGRLQLVHGAGETQAAAPAYYAKALIPVALPRRGQVRHRRDRAQLCGSSCLAGTFCGRAIGCCSPRWRLSSFISGMW
jgi:hypothetical protein